MTFKLWTIAIVLMLSISVAYCYIRPQETASRQIKLLDGIWKFKLAPEKGLEETRKFLEPKLAKAIVSIRFINEMLHFLKIFP